VIASASSAWDAAPVHAVEYGWLDAIRSVRVWAYRLPADRFRPVGEPEPRGRRGRDRGRSAHQEPVGDLLALREERISFES
jgi:hypothetical protein